MEGVGELSLCKVCCSGNLPTAITGETALAGDIRSHLIVSTEEGDVIFADICGRKAASVEPSHGKEEKEEEDELETSREYVRWISRDHSRPCVGLQQSPFFPDILLSVGDWNFHIWRVSTSEVSTSIDSYVTPYLRMSQQAVENIALQYVDFMPGSTHSHFAVLTVFYSLVYCIRWERRSRCLSPPSPPPISLVEPGLLLDLQCC